MLSKMKKHSPLRREFMRRLSRAGMAAMIPALPHWSHAQPRSTYRGKFLVTLQLEGGLDVTSFCDPKTNVSGEKEINIWARTEEIQEAGNLLFAPYADNAALFNRYYRDMLVINGVDAQTNSHTVGVTHNWSGRNSSGFPTLTSLFAVSQAPGLPMSYLNFGGFGETQSIIRSTLINDTRGLKEVIFPNEVNHSDGQQFLTDSKFDLIKSLHRENMEFLLADDQAIAGNLKNRRIFLEAISKTDEIKRFGDLIPTEDQFQLEREGEFRNSNLHQQIQIALLAFKAEVSVAADFHEGGFDTHENQDDELPWLLGTVTDAIDYMWSYAEELGIADRLVLVIGTDFGRTPHINASSGKDHWPIGSFLVMEKGARYTNRMFGETDEGHNAFHINPRTGRRDDADGVIIKPAHVHKALRRYLDIDDSPVTDRFAFNNIEDFNFFA